MLQFTSCGLEIILQLMGTDVTEVTELLPSPHAFKVWICYLTEVSLLKYVAAFESKLIV
jgi:hypothetical protein